MHKLSLVLTSYTAALALLLAGCSSDAKNTNSSNPSPVDDSGSDAGTDTATSPDSTSADMTSPPDANPDTADTADGGKTIPTFDELEAGWNEIIPGGETICSRGTEWAFYVHPGARDKVIIDFFGGGACWNEFTCSIADAIFSDSIDTVRLAVGAGVTPGIFDMENPANPFKDWTHIVLPYCTGDIHWGNRFATYGMGDTEVEIHHKGAVNSRTVLDWIDGNMEGLDKIFSTGCSAGSYGSILWAAHLMNEHPDATVYQFGDSGAGIITDSFFQDSFPAWNAVAAIPDWVDGIDPENILEMELTDMYVEIGKYYPNSVISQFNTLLDDNQTFYYEAMGGEGGAPEWSRKMRASLDAIKADTPNFRSYLAAGEKHCIIPDNGFYEHETNGIKLTDWLDDMVNDRPIDHVTCPECEM